MAKYNLEGIDKENLFDVIILGGGPAGLTAGIYMARDKYKTLVIEKQNYGGLIYLTDEVLNYPGISKISGPALGSTMKLQGESFGASYLNAPVTQIDLENDFKKIVTTKGTYYAPCIIIAMGSMPRELGFEGEAKFKGKGISYCTTCDGELYTGKEVFVVGGGLAAAEEAVALSKFATKITMLVKEDDLICPSDIAQKVYDHSDKITVLKNTIPIEVSGDTIPDTIKYKNTKTNEVFEFSSKENFGIFIFSGYVPNTKLLKDKIDLDQQDYILVDNNMQTSKEGVFAAGDIIQKKLRQVLTACGDGANASKSANEYIEKYYDESKNPRLEVNNTKTNEKEEKNNLESNKENVDKKETKQTVSTNNKFITNEMLPQLEKVFGKIPGTVTLELYVQDCKTSMELIQMMEELAQSVNNVQVNKNPIDEVGVPCVKISYNGQIAPYVFYGVPGGHEFTSFILAIYYLTAGKKEVDSYDLEKIQKIQDTYKHIDINAYVTLSCTKCPTLISTIVAVMGYAKNISLTIKDIAKFPEETQSLVSVPCFIVKKDDQEPLVEYGAKTISDFLEILV